MPQSLAPSAAETERISATTEKKLQKENEPEEQSKIHFFLLKMPVTSILCSSSCLHVHTTFLRMQLLKEYEVT